MEKQEDLMKILKGIFIILLHLALGHLCAGVIGDFIPASVWGMVLLFASLMLGVVKPDDVKTVAHFLTDNMTIFFLPAAIGIMDQWGLIKMNLLAWLAVVLISTVFVMLTTGLLQQWLMSITKKKDSDD